MIHKSIDSITKDDIESLISNKIPESRTLEYKEILPGNSNDDKKEFLKDVSAFANASGGDIIYGISEQRDSKGKATGLPAEAKGLSSINADAEKLRLENILRDSLDPRIIGLRVDSISGFSDGPIIIIRVPKSWNTPHMVVFNKTSKFYARNSTGAYQLDVTEIRSAFIASESLVERIRQFRSDRIAKVIADEMPIQVEPGAKLVLHLFPLSSLTTGTVVNVNAVDRGEIRLPPICAGSQEGRYNFDGYLNYSSNTLPYSYIQLFRNGVIEAVDVSLLQDRSHPKKDIGNSGFEKELIESLGEYLEAQKALGLMLPTVVMLSLTGVRDYRISHRRSVSSGELIDRDLLLIPEVLLEEYDREPLDILRPIFDTVWQACGWERCLNYDKDGKWVQRT
jgi:hypothetical protein